MRYNSAIFESTNLETIQDGALIPKLQHHSIFMDSAGDTSPFKADTDSSGVTASQLEASLKERATDLVLGTNTLVSGMFLGDAEEAIVSAFNGSKVQAMCAVGPHSAGTPTDLCPTYSSKEGRYIVDTWFSATDYIGAFSPGSDLENNWAVVAEAIQTILRREAYPNPYEALKGLTRTNEKINQQSISNFIDTLDVSETIKEELKAITPANYTGI